MKDNTLSDKQRNSFFKKINGKAEGNGLMERAVNPKETLNEPTDIDKTTIRQIIREEIGFAMKELTESIDLALSNKTILAENNKKGIGIAIMIDDKTFSGKVRRSK